jgi:hypothetical protein
MKRSFLIVVLCLFSLSSFAGKDPANYPLKVHILQVAWGSHIPRFNEFRATGRGNVWDGDSVHAFDFTYDCSFPVRRSARNQPYLGKWKKQQVRLDLLEPKIGTKDKYQECELQTTLHSGVYFFGDGNISEISQEDYKKMKAQHETAQAAPAGASKVSIASTPDSAEIEVDGEFMGNTPSTLELEPGEHNIAVKKTGYKAWEKKLKLTSGEINLNADLEADGSK